MRDERLITGAIEWRSADDGRSGPGTLTIRALKVGVRALDRPEQFDALPRVPDNGVALGRLHPAANAPIIGRAPVEERDGELIVSVELPDTSIARDVATEVRNGTLGAASIEFKALREKMVGGVRHIVESLCESIALVPRGAYQTAAEVRGARRARRWG